MVEIDQELEKYGLSREQYELCLDDIQGKMNGQNDMDWAEIVDKYNLGVHSDTLRKASQTIFGGAFIAEYFREKQSKGEVTNGYLALLKKEKEEIRKERQKLSDERVDYQKSIREEARKESFIEVIERAFARDIQPFDYVPSPITVGSDDMIVCLSDLHVGIEVDNHWNKYNTDILKARLSKYLDEIRNIQSTHHCNRCEVVLGGDNISGNIHPNLRLQNNENVVEQIKIAATYIGNFIMELHKHFSEVRVHSVSGNHSRMSPNKEEHLSGEELDALIPFFLSIKFENYSDVKICNDGYIDNSINSFVTRNDKLFYIVHGDKDKPSNVTHKLTMMTGKKPDAIIMHHRHHNAYDTQYGVKIVQVGCVVGSDDHCVDLRISGDPEQCVIITSETQAVKCIYDVSLR